MQHLQLRILFPFAARIWRNIFSDDSDRLHHGYGVHDKSSFSHAHVNPCAAGLFAYPKHVPGETRRCKSADEMWKWQKLLYAMNYFCLDSCCRCTHTRGTLDTDCVCPWHSAALSTSMLNICSFARDNIPAWWHEASERSLEHARRVGEHFCLFRLRRRNDCRTLNASHPNSI